MKKQTAVFAFAIWSVSSVASAQPSPQPLPEEARKRLDYAVGSWSSRTEVLDRKGRVKATRHSDDQRRFVVDDRIIEISGVSRESGEKFLAWEYYDVAEEKYSLTSINRNGRLMTMKGDLSEIFRWTSDDQIRADGSTMAMRFTHSDYTADSFTALGELSFDGGKTWRPFTRQFMTRRPSPAGSKDPAQQQPAPASPTSATNR